MIKFTKSFCWICVLLLFQPIHLFPQQPDFKFQHLTTADGLPTNSINHLFQDHLGFLWIANWEGLVRYDGYQFKIYQPDSANPYSINGRIIWRTNEDSEGNLWISTCYKGINKFDRKTEQFYHYKHDPQDSTSLSSNEIFTCYLDRSDLLWIVHQNGLLDRLDTKTGIIARCRHHPDDASSISHNFITTWRVSHLRLAALHEDKKGNIWIGTRGGGLNRYDKNTDSFTSYKHDPNDPNSISSDTVTCIYEDNENNLWISTWGGGLNRYLRETDTFNHYRHNSKDEITLANDYCLHIFEDKSNNLWLSVRNGLDLFNPRKNTFIHYKHNPENPYSLSRELFAIPLYEDNSGLIWFYIGGGDFLSFSAFDVFDPRKGKFFHCKEDLNNPQGLRGFHFYSLCKDHSGNVWICSDTRGINKLNPLRQNIIYYHHEPNNINSLCYNNSYAILESTSQPDIIWIGTKNGLDKYNRRTGVFTHLTHQPGKSNSLVNNNIYSVYEDRFGMLWIVTEGGLSCYDIKRAQFTNYTHNPEDSNSLCTNRLWSIYEDHLGTLWLGSIDRGLIRYQRENGSFTNYIHNPADSQSITPGRVWCIDEDREGNLWIGTTNGLNKFNRNNQTFTHYLTDRSIFVIHEDKHNNLWLGTLRDGLCPFNRQTGEAHFYDQKQGLCNNAINSIIEDDDGFLWLSTPSGLSKFNPRTAEFTNFSEEHGFPTQLFHVNGTKLKNGQIWLTTVDNGIVGFYPNQIKINTIPPRIVLTDIKLFNESLKIGTDSPLKQDISITREITFAHWQNDITIECAALHFSCPEKNQYAFWLENYDKDWYYTGTNRIASYTNLDPGEYIFHAKGSNSDKVWNEDGVSLRIIIHPPWWRTFWAYGLYVLIIGSIVFVIWQNQVRRIHLRNELKMRQFEAKKLQEIDHIKSRFFANISHEFRTPLTLILGPIEKLLSEITNPKWKNQLQITIRNSQQLLRLINQLLDFSKLEAGRMSLRAKKQDIIPLIKGIVFSFMSLSERKRITLTFKTEQDSILVFIDQDKVEKILSNLLSNAFKFTSEGGMITVQVAKKFDKKGEWSFAPAAEETVEIKIIDTGIGMAPEHLDHIFDRYYQVDDKGGGAGTGIGLALTKELTVLHHGQITVQSELGKGSTFIIYFPLGKAHLKKHEIIDEKGEEPIITLEKDDRLSDIKYRKQKIEKEIQEIQPPKTKIRRQLPIVLIVEDNQDVRAYIRDFLESDYRVKEARDGVDGFEKATNTIPDLIISDVMMPNMDGFELCEKLKTDERTSHIPVILLTARASEKSKLEGLETGADDYIIKPFSARELQVRVKNLIEQRRKLRERFSHESALKPKDIAITSADERFLQRAMDTIEAQIGNPDFSVNDFGKKVGLSHSQLHRKIRALTDRSPIEFIRTLRLKRAADLLKQHFGNVAEIAYEVGFNNPSYFAECFRKLFGKSPSEYAANASLE
jgi:signal transduction histidine kinase/ligand-binding sensor domain-containing protein/DNA-binding response OmpR family regulator